MVILGEWVFLMSEIPVYDLSARNNLFAQDWSFKSKTPSGAVRALNPNTVEPIPNLGALFPRVGPVQDPSLTGLSHRTYQLDGSSQVNSPTNPST